MRPETDEWTPTEREKREQTPASNPCANSVIPTRPGLKKLLCERKTVAAQHHFNMVFNDLEKFVNF